MNLWHLYFYGLYLNWLKSVQEDMMKWAVVSCPGRVYPVEIITKI